MAYWSYGLIEEDGELKLAEIYFNKKGKKIMHLTLTWKEINNHKEMISNDLVAQLKHKTKYNYKYKTRKKRS